MGNSVGLLFGLGSFLFSLFFLFFVAFKDYYQYFPALGVYVLYVESSNLQYTYPTHASIFFSFVRFHFLYLSAAQMS